MYVRVYLLTRWEIYGVKGYNKEVCICVYISID